MYIRNRKFKDEDTLFEVLYDFEIGNTQLYIDEVYSVVNQQFVSNEALNKELTNMESEDALAYIDDWKREQVVKILLQDFESFVVNNNSFFGIKGNQQVPLYTIDME